MEKLKTFIEEHKKLSLLIGLAMIIIAAIITWLVSSQQPQQRIDITEAISQDLSQDSFWVKDIVLEADDWYLTEIAATDESATPGYYLIQKQADDYRTVLGPGTSFSPEDLYLAGAPDEVFRYFFGDEAVWLNMPEIYNVMSNNNVVNTRDLIKQFAASRDIDLSKVIIEKDSLQLITENERQPDVFYRTSFVVMLNTIGTDKYTVQIDESLGVVTGRLVDSSGNEVAKKTYRIDYRQ